MSETRRDPDEESGEHTNADRREHGRMLVDAYAAECGPDESNLCDMLADLMHLCDDPDMEWSFDQELERARGHYDAERDEADRG